MNKLKHVVIMISAFSLMGVASISFASSCSTTISPSTATCLSSNADQTFQNNYQTEYTKQKAGLGGSSYYSQPSEQSNYNRNASNSALQQEETTTPTNTNDSSDNNNNTNKSSIHWF